MHATLLQSDVECNAKPSEVAKTNTNESHDWDADSAMNWTARAKVDQGVATDEHDRQLDEHEVVLYVVLERHQESLDRDELNSYELWSFVECLLRIHYFVLVDFK